MRHVTLSECQDWEPRPMYVLIGLCMQVNTSLEPLDRLTGPLNNATSLPLPSSAVFVAVTDD